MRIAIVGAGIAGLASAWLLRKAGHEVAVFEAADYLGGHSHTVDVILDGARAAVDTGFLVYNDRTYPRLAALFAELGIATVASEMSFSARIADAGARASFEPIQSRTFGCDYAETLRRWLAAFDAEEDSVRAQGFDDAFIRCWRFYLAYCIAGFASGSTDVAQHRLVAR